MVSALRALLAEQALFDGIEPDDLERLAHCGSLMDFAPGELIFREGDEATRCFVVRTGTVHVGLHHPARGRLGLASVEPGEMLGWSWLFEPNRWRFDATAGDTCGLIAFDARCFTTTLDEHPHVGYVLMTRLARQASDRLLLARKQLADLYNPRPQPVAGGDTGKGAS